MSAARGRWRLVKVGEGWWRPIGKNPRAAGAIPPTSTILHHPPRPLTTSFDIAHPPDPIARVVAHQQRPVPHHDHPYPLPSFRMFRCSGGTLSPRLSRSLLFAQSSPVVG